MVLVPLMFLGGLPGMLRWRAGRREERALAAISDRLVGREGSEAELLVELNARAEQGNQTDDRGRAELADQLVAELRAHAAERGRADHPRRARQPRLAR